MAKANSETTTEQVVQPEVSNEQAAATLDTNLNEALASLVNAQATFIAAGASGDMKAMLDGAEAVKKAEREVEKATTAKNSWLFNQKSAERGAVAGKIHADLKAFIASSVDVAGAAAIGLTGISIIFNKDDGSVAVNVMAEKGPAAPKVGGSTRIPGTGGGKGRNKWLFNGAEYSSHDLLITFGGDEGAKAIDRARNFENYGMKFSPGFDAPVKKLAKEIGAERVTS